jgi:hypothetical protein
MEAVKFDVYVYASFFNALGAEASTTPHKNLNKLGKGIGFDLSKQK